MRNIIFLLICMITVFASCTKKDPTCNRTDSTVTASAAETQNVQTYLNNNGITGTTLHPSGFYYKIAAAGTGSSVINLCSGVTVKYSGKLTNGTVFDPPAGSNSTTSTASFTLGNLIIGWQKGIPLIKSGGKIALYLPPSLGYGAQASGTIPANSILIFDIELLNVY